MYFKKIILLLIIGFIANDVYSQTAFSFGPKLGVNFSKLRGDDAINVDNRTGFAGGIFLNVVPGAQGIFAVAPELLFQHRGATNHNDVVNVTQRIKVNYMTVPIPVKFRIPIDETFYPNVFVGPEFAFLLKSSYEAEHANSGVGITDQDIDVRKGDIGGIFGAGLDIESDRFFFNIELRYGMGALKIDKDDNNQLDLKNSQFTILTGIGIRLGG